MSLRFHLERQTGGMTRDIERGTRAVHSLISYSLYSIFPTLIEVTLVLTLLAVKFDAWFAWITITALVFYIGFTFIVTEWRTQYRKQMNELDSAAHSRAIDALLNYETVKYFNNEDFEARRYDENLEKLRKAGLKSQSTLSLLNTGQQLIIATALVAMLWRATAGVVEGRMTLGDLVMVNAFMIQLYIPLTFLGVIYREIKQSLTDMDRMFSLLDDLHHARRQALLAIGVLRSERTRRLVDLHGLLRLEQAVEDARPGDVGRACALGTQPGGGILEVRQHAVAAGGALGGGGPAEHRRAAVAALLGQFLPGRLGGEHAGDERGVLDAARKRADLVERVRVGLGARPRDQARRRLVADHAAVRGRADHRARGLRAQRHRGEVRGDRRRRAARARGTEMTS